MTSNIMLYGIDLHVHALRKEFFTTLANGLFITYLKQ